MNSEKESDIKISNDDNSFKVVNLPVEEQHQTTSEERKKYFEELKKKELSIEEVAPLTTDVHSRGYPITESELEVIRKINDYEKSLLEKHPNLKPNNLYGTKYYIVEDGEVFKTIDFGIYYGLDVDSMEWFEDPRYMDIMFDTILRFSQLQNFRDYYSEKNKKEEESKMFPK